MQSDRILEVKNLVKGYKNQTGKKLIAVDDISFGVDRGEIVGILRPNGAGKTSIVKMICGLIIPDSGEILIDGMDNFKYRNRATSKISAVLEGNRNIYWQLTVKENIELFLAIKGIEPKTVRDKIDYCIEIFKLKDKENAVAKKLSGGMQQKLAIIIAMASGSPLVILDEPTLGLDVEASYEIRGLLKDIAQKETRTIIVTSHDMNLVQHVCEQVITINSGRIVVKDNISNLFQLFKFNTYQPIISRKIEKEEEQLLLSVNGVSIRKTEMKKFFLLIKAYLKREAIILKRYLFETLSELVTFYFLFLLLFWDIKGIATDSPTIGNTIEGLVVSYTLWLLSFAAFQSVSMSLRDEATQGTLEQLYMPSSSFGSMMICQIFTAILFNSFTITAILILLMIATGKYLNIDLISIFIIVFFMLLSFIGTGFLVGGLTLIFKRVKSFSQAIGFMIFGIVRVPAKSNRLLKILPGNWGTYTIKEVMVNNRSICLLKCYKTGKNACQ